MADKFTSQMIIHKFSTFVDFGKGYFKTPLPFGKKNVSNKFNTFKNIFYLCTLIL